MKSLQAVTVAHGLAAMPLPSAPAYGVPSCWEAPADAGLIRAAVGTRAELIIVRRDNLPLADSVGALLRYVDADT